MEIHNGDLVESLSLLSSTPSPVEAIGAFPGPMVGHVLLFPKLPPPIGCPN